MAEEAATSSGIRKARSPNYPVFDLAQAIEHARTLFPEIKRHAVTRGDIAKVLKYSEKSSSGLQLIGALVAFGILDSEGRGSSRRLALSKDALQIVHGISGSPEHKAAMRACALNPVAHQTLWAKYGKDLPASDQIIRTFLIVEKGFTEDAATQLIREYRATFKTAGLDESDVSGKNEPNLLDGIGKADDDEQDPPPALKSGDWVQWTSKGQTMWSAPRMVQGFSADGKLVAVEGTEQMVPANELKIEKPGSGIPAGPPVFHANPFYTPPQPAGVPISVVMGKGEAQVITIPKMTRKAFDFFKAQLDAFAEAIIKDDSDAEAK